MSFEHHPFRHHSIVTPVELDTSAETFFNSSQNYNRPLINTATASNCTSDSEIARLEQERMYAESLTNTQPPPQASPVDMRTSEEIEADAAYALRLQEEEYSRKSIVPNRSSAGPRRNMRATIFSDAELAAQLQEEENQGQRRHRLGATGPALREGPRPTSGRFDRVLNAPFIQPQQQSAGRSDDTDPEVIPMPFPARINQRRVPANRNNNNSSSMNRGGRRGGIRNLENSSHDFGPNDYDRLIELDNSVADTRLSSNRINQLPTEKFRPAANRSSEENTCNICWDEFEADQTIRRLPCLHIYHQGCIDKWLKTNNSCPICRIAAIK